ncbi:MAG: hypothetical protein RBU37_25005, partial [Myxococcota bacterium]|nr:hypothetical protein [Myxococcota bacterium]
GKYCTSTPCEIGGCPGDSVCWQYSFSTGTQTFCMNPDANQNICNTGWTCSDASTCAGFGTDCSGGDEICFYVGAATCLTISEGGVASSFCTCKCTVDADCGAGNRCITLGSGQRYCRPGSSSSGLCDGVVCTGGLSCDPGTGRCVDPNDLCANVQCPPGAMCSPATGTCIGGEDKCATVVCLPGYTCNASDGLCHQNAPDPDPDPEPIDTEENSDVEWVDYNPLDEPIGPLDPPAEVSDGGSDAAADSGNEPGKVIVVDNCACATSRASAAPLFSAWVLLFGFFFYARWRRS